MNDLVQRLKTHADYHGDHTSSDIELAADTIATLTAALEGLVQATEAADVTDGRESVWAQSPEMLAARAALREVGRG